MRSNKDWLTTLLLCIFFGGMGIHRFYAGKIGTGLAMLFTVGGCGVWALVDLILIICGKFTDSNGNPILSDSQAQEQGIPVNNFQTGYQQQYNPNVNMNNNGYNPNMNNGNNGYYSSYNPNANTDYNSNYNSNYNGNQGNYNGYNNPNN